jgi:hypothetical protein
MHGDIVVKVRTDTRRGAARPARRRAAQLEGRSGLAPEGEAVVALIAAKGVKGNFVKLAGRAAVASLPSAVNIEVLVVVAK